MRVQIRKLSMAHLLQVLDLVLVICSCSATQNLFKKMINTHLTNSNVTTQRASVIACCHDCNIYSWCQSLSYKASSKECHVSSVGCTSVGSSSDNDNEWVTFVKNCSATTGYLARGLSNGQFTASSKFGAHHPWYARLNGPWGWASGSSNTNQYVQVDLTQVRVIVAFALQGRHPRGGYSGHVTRFRVLTSADCVTFSYIVDDSDDKKVDLTQVRVIVAFALQGRHPRGGYSGHVTRFRVLTSADCVTFSYIVDDSDDKKIFDGNTGLRETVHRYLQRGWVLARCVRINPVVWYSFPILRFDVIGF